MYKFVSVFSLYRYIKKTTKKSYCWVTVIKKTSVSYLVFALKMFPNIICSGFLKWILDFSKFAFVSSLLSYGLPLAFNSSCCHTFFLEKLMICPFSSSGMFCS